MDEKEFRYGRRVTLFGIAGNVLVSAVELFLGIIGRSSALIADAIHSLSDVGGTTAVYVGLKYSSVPKDKNHPYGHGKIESIIALFLLTTFISLYPAWNAGKMEPIQAIYRS
ncbi:cation transporter [candidate division KSB1 bacterium]|nr:cation transporter [candidate division KSB1 bacterium]